MTDAVSRARLISRVEIEARAYRNADYTTKAIRWERVLGLIEASGFTRPRPGGEKRPPLATLELPGSGVSLEKVPEVVGRFCPIGP